MDLEGKRIAVLAEDEYQELELWYSLLRMREAGAEVKVLGPRNMTYKSKMGYPVTTDAAMDEVRPEQFDAVIIPGGYAPDRMRRHRAVLEFIQELDRQKKLVAAICHAGWVLASAGIVRGREVTSFWSIKDDMVNAGANWTDREVVVDGNLITSRVPDDLPAFCREIVRALSKVGATA